MAPEAPLSAKLTAEFIGTFFLVYTVCCNVMGGTSPAFVALSIASVLMVMIYALGDVSGGHFNPAVSTAIALCSREKWSTVAMYVPTQIAAGVVAGFTAKLMYGGMFNLAPGSGFTWLNAAGVEVLYTMMLCFVVLNVACCKANSVNQYYGLAIGMVIVAGGYAGGSISGGAFNPAVAIGIDSASWDKGFGWSLAYTGFELVGAALAALAYKYCRPEEFDSSAKGGLFSKLLSEFLGTFFLVLTVGLNVLTGSLSTALSAAFALTVMIYALGTASGAHFNPAVTAAILFSGRGIIDTTTAAYYCASQIFGAIIASLVYSTLTGGKSFGVGPVGESSWLDVFLAEAIFTFVLTFTVLAVATTKTPSKDMFGLAIGACVTVGAFAAGGVSGGALNPAAAIGIETGHAIHAGGSIVDSLAYTAFEVAGAGAAALTFSITHPLEYTK